MTQGQELIIKNSGLPDTIKVGDHIYKLKSTGLLGGGFQLCYYNPSYQRNDYPAAKNVSCNIASVVEKELRTCIDLLQAKLEHIKYEEIEPVEWMVLSYPDADKGPFDAMP